ncbi:MAG: hypothetical protein WAL75_10890 [Terracidiphilus sp.]
MRVNNNRHVEQTQRAGDGRQIPAPGLAYSRIARPAEQKHQATGEFHTYR